MLKIIDGKLSDIISNMIRQKVFVSVLDKFLTLLIKAI
jgi:hypothetical protein